MIRSVGGRYYIRSALAVGCAALLASCADRAPTAPGAFQPHASRAAAAAAEIPVLTWLEPLGTGVADSATFDASAAPTVEVCVWSGGSCAGAPVARFSTAPAANDLPLTVNARVGQYEASWSLTDARLTTRRTYRVHVLQGTTELGGVSVDVVRGRWAPTRPDSALAPLAAASMLPIRFGLSRGAKLVVVFGPGVAGTLDTGTRTYAPGTRVPYAFRATEGYRNVGVVLDGTDTLATGEVAMGVDHVLLVGAERVSPVSAPAQPLVPLAAALLRAADPVTARNAEQAFEATLDTLYNTLGPAETWKQLIALGAATFDPVRDSAALRRFAEALGAANSPLPSSGQRSRSVRSVGGVRTSAAAQERPTTVFVVNGILTNQASFASGSLAIRAIVSEAAVATGKSDVTVVPFYNATSWASEYGGKALCIHGYGDREEWLNPFVLLNEFSACVSGLAGVPEVLAQYWAGVSSDPGEPVERAADLAAAIRTALESGRNVVVVAHSQGNLMTQQALRALETALPAGTLDCVAVTSIAPPVSKNWPPVERAALFAHGTQTQDILLDVIKPKPTGTVVRSDVTDAADARVRRYYSWVDDPGLRLESSARIRGIRERNEYVVAQNVMLHGLVESYARGDGTREFIRNSISSNLQKVGTACADRPPLASGRLANGLTYTGRVAEVGETDAWTFTAGKGDYVVVSAGETGTFSATFAPWVRVYGPGGTLVGRDPLNAGPAMGQASFNAPESGTYTVVVASGDAGINIPTTGTGDYRLTMIKSSGALETSPDDQGGPLANGGTAVGNIYIGDVDAWTFTARAGEYLTLSMGEDDLHSATFAPQIRLVSPTGALVASDRGAVTARVGAPAPATGTYTVLVETGDDGINVPRLGTGAYRLSLVRGGAAVVTADGDQGGPLVNGITHAGRINAGDLDSWTFQAAADEYFLVSVGKRSGSDNFQPDILVLGPDGAVVTRDNAGFPRGVTAQVGGQAPRAGTYTVVVGSGDYVINGLHYAGTGDYRLTLVRSGSAVTQSPDDQGGLMLNGANYDGDLYAGDLDGWSFTLNAGDYLRVSVGQRGGTDDFQPAIWVLGPDGAVLGYDNAGFPRGTVAQVEGHAPRAGRYTVVVSSGDAVLGGRHAVGAGTYRLTSVRVPDGSTVSRGDEGGTLTDGVGGYIDVGDLDAWTLDAQAGDTLSIQMTRGASTLQAAFRLVDGSGRFVAEGRDPYNRRDEPARVRLVVPATTTYTVVAYSGDAVLGGPHNTGNGGYTLNVTRAGVTPRRDPRPRVVR